ncbi:MAG: patatin-like phospholipase family protein [Acidimicrobiales bacterium]
MRLALVLGAGGLVGIAHHIGVMCALEDVLGFQHTQADLLVGTSAGSAVAAYLRTGWAPHGLMERVDELHEAAPAPLGGGAVDLLRHGVGSAYVLARATVRFPSLLSLPPMPLLRRAFPAGVVTMREGASILDRELPRSWPDGRLWLAAYDLVARRRVVLGRPGQPYVDLPSAVRASCAIPGIYAPVRAGSCVLVDGGSWSLTNLDLVALGGCDTALCIAPMSYDVSRPPRARDRLAREVPTRLLSLSAERLRRQGIRVLTMSPGPREIAVQGVNLMRSGNLAEVADVAYAEAATHLRRLQQSGDLGGLAA